MKLSEKQFKVIFDVVIFIKGFDGAVEFLGGLALLIVGPSTIHRLIPLMYGDELAHDPDNFLATHILRLGTHFTEAALWFAAFYLIAHGVVKLILAIALLKNIRIAYPIGLVLFGGVILYEIYRVIQYGSIVLTVFTVFDCIVIWLVWREWQIQKRPVLREHAPE